MVIENRSQVVDEMATAMANINDLGTTAFHYSEEAITVLEQHGLTFATSGDREDLVFECGFVILESNDAQAMKGNYSGDWKADAEAVLQATEKFVYA